MTTRTKDLFINMTCALLAIVVFAALTTCAGCTTLPREPYDHVPNATEMHSDGTRTIYRQPDPKP